jgi:hypothetical protein
MYFINETEMGATTTINATTCVSLFFVPAPERRYLNISEDQQELEGFDYLVESSGELLKVFRRWDYFRLKYMPLKYYAHGLKSLECAYFEIFRLDCAHGYPRWVNVDSIGNRMYLLILCMVFL